MTMCFFCHRRHGLPDRSRFRRFSLIAPALAFGPKRDARLLARISTGFPSPPITIFVFLTLEGAFFLLLLLLVVLVGTVLLGMPVLALPVSIAATVLATGLEGGGELCMDIEADISPGLTRSRNRCGGRRSLSTREVGVFSLTMSC